MYCNYMYCMHEITASKPRTIQPFLVAVLDFAVLLVAVLTVNRSSAPIPTVRSVQHAHSKKFSSKRTVKHTEKYNISTL